MEFTIAITKQPAKKPYAYYYCLMLVVINDNIGYEGIFGFLLTGWYLPKIIKQQNSGDPSIEGMIDRYTRKLSCLTRVANSTEMAIK